MHHSCTTDSCPCRNTKHETILRLSNSRYNRNRSNIYATYSSKKCDKMIRFERRLSVLLKKLVETGNSHADSLRLQEEDESAPSIWIGRLVGNAASPFRESAPAGLRSPLPFLGCGEQDIVKNQSVSRRILVQGQFGWILSDDMRVVLGVVSPEQCKRSLAEVSM